MDLHESENTRILSSGSSHLPAGACAKRLELQHRPLRNFGEGSSHSWVQAKVLCTTYCGNLPDGLQGPWNPKLGYTQVFGYAQATVSPTRATIRRLDTQSWLTLHTGVWMGTSMSQRGVPLLLVCLDRVHTAVIVVHHASESVA